MATKNGGLNHDHTVQVEEKDNFVVLQLEHQKEVIKTKETKAVLLSQRHQMTHSSFNALYDSIDIK